MTPVIFSDSSPLKAQPNIKFQTTEIKHFKLINSPGIEFNSSLTSYKKEEFLPKFPFLNVQLFMVSCSCG